MQLKVQSERYKGIDLLKFVCIFLVIMIHVAPFAGGSENPANYISQKIIARISVPSFFVASGFLLFGKFSVNEYSKEKVKKYLLSVLRLYLVWTILYSPFIVHGILTQEKGVRTGLLLAVRDFFLTGSYTHLWYLNALMVSVLLICLLLKKGMKIRSILAVSFVLFLIGLLGQTYFGLLLPLKENVGVWAVLKTAGAIIGTTRNGLFEGFFFVSMGAFFAWYRERICKGCNSVLIPIASLGMLLCEGLLIKKYGHPFEWNTYLCSGISTFCIFRYVIDPRRQWKISSKLGKWMRNIVEIVFLLHLWVRAVADRILPSALSGIPFLGFLFVVIFSFLVGQVLLSLSEKKAFRFLKVIL